MSKNNTPLPDEGYIKFNCDWQKTKAFPQVTIEQLNRWRQKLYDANLVGAYPDGIGFGNVSQRAADNQFYISGSTTGNFKKLSNEHFSLVTHFDFEKNEVHCKGPIIASSESLSHAIIYQEVPSVMAVFHVHHLALWEKVLHQIPTTDSAATYGSPEMAKEITRLIKETDVLQRRVFAMGGHKEGLISFGKTKEEAGEAVLSLLEKNF